MSVGSRVSVGAGALVDAAPVIVKNASSLVTPRPCSMSATAYVPGVKAGTTNKRVALPTSKWLRAATDPARCSKSSRAHDGQRHAIEAPTELAHSQLPLLAQLEVWLDECLRQPQMPVK